MDDQKQIECELCGNTYEATSEGRDSHQNDYYHRMQRVLTNRAKDGWINCFEGAKRAMGWRRYYEQEGSRRRTPMDFYTASDVEDWLCSKQPDECKPTQFILRTALEAQKLVRESGVSWKRAIETVVPDVQTRNNALPYHWIE